MICRVCLLNSTERMEIFGIVGAKLEIASIISQHLWFEPKLDDPISNMICTACWRKLDSFHKFYTTVEEAHSKLSEHLFVKEEPDIKNEVSDNIRLHISGPDYFNNEWNEQNSLGSENTEGIPADEERMHVAEPLRVENTNEVQEYSTAEEETKPSTFTELKEMPKDKPDNEEFPEELVASADEESSKLQNRRKNRDRSLLRRIGANRKENENSNNSSPEDASRQSKLKEKYKPSKRFKISKEDDEKIAKHMKLKCEICGEEFSIFVEVLKHYRTVHKQKGYVVCCNKKLRDRVAALGHINRHLNPDYFKCTECNEVLCDSASLARHKLRHLYEEDKIYKCDKCPRRYAKPFLLDMHKVIHTPQEECKFICDDCGKAFPTHILFIRHRRKVHENTYVKTCPICAKVIKGATMYKKHQLEHEGVVEPKRQCQVCGLWLKNDSSLKRHMYLHIEKLSTHICNICGKTSASKATLRDHVRMVHEPESLLHCSVCDKAFLRPIRLRDHMTSHTGEPLYTCPYCPKTFKLSGNMYKHKKQAHRKEWEENRSSHGLPTTDIKSIDSETD